MRHLLKILLPLLFLTACQTTQIEEMGARKSKPVDQATGKYNIGTYVGYSEVCSEFRGSGTDNEIILAIKRAFEGDTDFARGYAEYDNFTGFDFVTGLNSCGEVKEALEKIYKALVEAGGLKI
ncbi:MAG: hypothetical protein WDZ54_06455 [Sneathiella sp.]